MLDIKFIRENIDIIKKAVKDKGYSLDIQKLLKIDNERVKLLNEVESLRAEQNKIIKVISGKPTKKQLEKSKKLKDKLEFLTPKLKGIENDFNEIMLTVPNIPTKDTPIGKDESENKEIKKWGKITKFNFPVLDHIELGQKNNLIDLERGVKIGGTRSYVLKNELVLLEQALLRYALDKIRKEGFEVMNVPVIVKEDVLYGSGFFPFLKEDIYKLDKDKYLTGTSEASLVYYYKDEILNESDLPRFIGAITPCFRKEAGTYGKDSKGLIRVHQFNKVEQVILCKKEEAEKMFNFMLNISEEIVRALELPYRLISICTGDLGAKNTKQTDIEIWFPAQQKYRETHSCSYLTDFQSRRLNIKYRDDRSEKHFIHTLNNTVVATPRILGAILENYQQKDGSIKIPDVLKKYTGFDKISK